MLMWDVRLWECFEKWKEEERKKTNMVTPTRPLLEPMKKNFFLNEKRMEKIYIVLSVLRSWRFEFSRHKKINPIVLFFWSIRQALHRKSASKRKFLFRWREMREKISMAFHPPFWFLFNFMLAAGFTFRLRYCFTSHKSGKSAWSTTTSDRVCADTSSVHTHTLVKYTNSKRANTNARTFRFV